MQQACGSDLVVILLRANDVGDHCLKASPVLQGIDVEIEAALVRRPTDKGQVKALDDAALAFRARHDDESNRGARHAALHRLREKVARSLVDGPPQHVLEERVQEVAMLLQVFGGAEYD